VRIPLLLTIALALSLACAPGDATRASTHARRTNVVLICLDTVRADYLGCYGYERHATTPTIDALAQNALVFDDCWAAACWTKPSVPSFLTGTFPLQHGVYEGSSRSSHGTQSDVLPDAATTLAEVFSANGFATAAFVRNAQLRLGMGFEQGFDVYRDKAGDARQIRWHATDWLDERPQDRPFFLYLHLLDAHWPYPVPDEYASRFTDAGAASFFRDDDWRGLRNSINDGTTQLDDDKLAALKAIYAGSLRYIDDELARFFRVLSERGLESNTIVCIVSDHGEEFLEHGRIGHGHGLSQELLQVPWILKLPGVEGRRVHEPVSLVDLFPTLLSAAGLVNSAPGPGVNRLAPEATPSVLFAEHKTSGHYEQGWRDGATKLVRTIRPGQSPAGETVHDVPTIGLRYEVFLRSKDDGSFVAARVRPRPDADSDPLEVKGAVADLDDSRFLLNGIRVELKKDAELYGETTDAAGRERPLANGLPVKARGELIDGTLVCRKLKLYKPGASELAVRGTLQEVDGAHLVLAGITLRLDDETRLEHTFQDPELTRHDILAAVGEAGFERFEVSVKLTGLDATRAVEVPRDDPVEQRRLVEMLNAFGGRLVDERIWTGDERRGLGDDELEALRALGYVD